MNQKDDNPWESPVEKEKPISRPDAEQDTPKEAPPERKKSEEESGSN